MSPIIFHNRNFFLFNVFYFSIFPFFRGSFFGGGVYKAKIPHFANLSLNHFKIAAIKFNIFLVIKRIYYRLTNYEIQISFIMHRSIYTQEQIKI